VGRFLELSLNALQLDYVDLYLIHVPIGFEYSNDKEIGIFTKTDNKIRLDKLTDLEAVWKAMEAQVDAGKAKSIGLSNFNLEQIERIVTSARIQPANLQVYFDFGIGKKLKICFAMICCFYLDV